MSIWAVANQKGGVGKTTTAISLAGWLVARKERVLLIDLDPHGSMTSYFGLDPDSISQGVYQLFQKADSKQALDINQLILSTQFENLDILPSSTAIATLDRQLGTKDGMGLVIARAILSLEKMATGESYSHVFIDCPPMLGVLMINALAACDRLLIPVQTEFLAVKGLDRMLSTLSMINRSRKRPLKYTIIPTLFDRRTRASIETLRLIKENYSAKSLANTVIPVDTRFREASMKGAPLPLLNPHSRGAIAYSFLLDGLLSAEKTSAEKTSAEKTNAEKIGADHG